jgi:hypothetical protein
LHSAGSWRRRNVSDHPSRRARGRAPQDDAHLPLYIPVILGRERRRASKETGPRIGRAVPQRMTPRSRDELRPSFKPVVIPRQQREQGMPGVWLARSLVRNNKKHTSKYTTGQPKRSGIPRAMALRLIPRSLRRSGVLVTVVSVMRSIVANFTPASRRQDHAALSSATDAFVLCAICGHRIPHPTSVTIAIRPSWWARDGRISASDLPDEASKTPATQWHDGQISWGQRIRVK